MKLFSVALLFVGTAALGVATPFLNGSFEAPGATYSPPARYLTYGDTFVTGWVHDVTDLGEFYTNGAVWDVTAGDGSHYVGFGAFGQIGGTMSQTFDTVVGVTYYVNYLLTTQESTGVLPDQIALVEALDGATVLASVSNTINHPAGVWISGLTLYFQAVSTATTLRITDATLFANSPTLNWGLDAVTLSETPEPSSFALLGLGCGLLFLRTRKRRRPPIHSAK